MLEISQKTETKEIAKPEVKNYKEIKPEGNISVQEAKEYLYNLFKNKEINNIKKDLEKTTKDYFNDLKEKSDCPETISNKPFQISDLKKLSPEENAKMRDEFDDKKVDLKKEWEEINGKSWPKYEEDIYSSNGKLIRKAGSDYDAHHIQPLGMGGKNEANNITPLHAEVHYDKQGIHASDSPYSKLDEILGGIDR